MAHPLQPEDGQELLAEADVEVSSRWETVLLLGVPDTIEAGREWRHAAWHVEWFARGLLTDHEEFEQAMESSGAGRRRFYEMARKDLDVDGGPLPNKLMGMPAWAADRGGQEGTPDPKAV
jgi:hypothetical protein